MAEKNNFVQVYAIPREHKTAVQNSGANRYSVGNGPSFIQIRGEHDENCYHAISFGGLVNVALDKDKALGENVNLTISAQNGYWFNDACDGMEKMLRELNADVAPGRSAYIGEGDRWEDGI